MGDPHGYLEMKVEAVLVPDGDDNGKIASKG